MTALPLLFSAEMSPLTSRRGGCRRKRRRSSIEKWELVFVFPERRIILLSRLPHFSFVIRIRRKIAHFSLKNFQPVESVRSLESESNHAVNRFHVQDALDRVMFYTITKSAAKINAQNKYRETKRNHVDSFATLSPRFFCPSFLAQSVDCLPQNPVQVQLVHRD